MVPGDGRARTADGAASGALLVAEICAACVQTLPIAGAAVSVMTPGGHRGVAFATDAIARALEDVQFIVGEGPGCAAFASGRTVLVPDVAVLAEWTAFGDVAREFGVRAVFAFPLHLGAASLGALSVYDLEPRALAGEQLARAVRLADAASVAVLDMIVGTTMRETGPLDGDGSGGSDKPELLRAEVYQAAGMVMIQLGVSIEVAMVRVRSHAFATGRPIGDIASEIVRRELRLEADDEGTPAKA